VASCRNANPSPAHVHLRHEQVHEKDVEHRRNAQREQTNRRVLLPLTISNDRSCLDMTVNTRRDPLHVLGGQGCNLRILSNRDKDVVNEENGDDRNAKD